MGESLTPDSYREKELVKQIVADLVVSCLWDERVCEATGETPEHEIRAWREDGQVHSVVKHK